MTIQPNIPEFDFPSDPFEALIECAHTHAARALIISAAGGQRLKGVAVCDGECALGGTLRQCTAVEDDGRAALPEATRLVRELDSSLGMIELQRQARSVQPVGARAAQAVAELDVVDLAHAVTTAAYRLRRAGRELAGHHIQAAEVFNETADTLVGLLKVTADVLAVAT